MTRINAMQKGPFNANFAVSNLLKSAVIFSIRFFITVAFVFFTKKYEIGMIILLTMVLPVYFFYNLGLLRCKCWMRQSSAQEHISASMEDGCCKCWMRQSSRQEAHQWRIIIIGLNLIKFRATTEYKYWPILSMG